MLYIVIFIPAIIALYVDLKINNRNEFNKLDILKYLIYVFFVNYIGNFFVWLISSEKYYYYTQSTFTYDFCFKYMSISIITALLLPIIFKISYENIKFSIEVKGKNDNK